MSGHGEKLSRKQRIAVMALLEEPTIELAATRVGVSEATLRRWRQRSDFQAELREAQDRLVASSMDDLRHAGHQAVATLVRNFDCGSPSVEVRAATACLDLMVRVAEVDSLRRRVEDLERMYREAPSG